MMKRDRLETNHSVGTLARNKSPVEISARYTFYHITPLESLITRQLNTTMVGHHLQSMPSTNLWAERQILPNPAMMEWSPSLKQHYHIVH